MVQSTFLFNRSGSALIRGPAVLVPLYLDLCPPSGVVEFAYHKRKSTNNVNQDRVGFQPTSLQC